jgi:dolichol-phosphate mannosyltransferase
VLPTLDEAANLPRLVARIRELDVPVDILVVDDESSDGTAQLADELAARDAGIHVLHRVGRRGYGPALVEGLAAALERDVSAVLTMDCDFSHDPAELPRLLDASGSADLVIGSRYVAGGTLRNWPVHRVLLSTVANWYVRSITRLPVHDCTSGFRCWSRDLLARLPLAGIVSDGYAFQVEMTWEARAAGGRIVEVPITFVERRQGSSKLSGTVIGESIVLPWRLAARPRRGR